MGEKIKSYIPKAYCVLSLSLVVSYIECICYNFWLPNKWKPFWFTIVLLVCLALIIIKKYTKQTILNYLSTEAISLTSTLFFFLDIKYSWVYNLFNNHINWITIIVLLNEIISVVIFKHSFYVSLESAPKTQTPKKLFNIFYLNTSKAHEIAMLIDNKIMKSIEQEQTIEERLQQSTSLSLGGKDSALANTEVTFENNYKNRVYESFDVKSTKSIMLRRIYESISEKSDNSLQAGNIRIFENVELQQVNVDDTVMVLNILQDSNIRNQGNDSVEININKMMDKMLDDFTIDYTFEYKVNQSETHKKFLIQLPYKTNNNFENGYQHNDLQLGKLSIIGIYRGNIDFSKRQSISSKFLDLFSKSYNQNNSKTNQKVDNEMKLSSAEGKNEEIEFNLHHKKLNEQLHLIDVIAIIQEISLKKDE